MPRKRVLDAGLKVINLRPRFEQPRVKSAERVIQILELFDNLQSPATVIDISDNLGFPQSSTAALLRSLEATGYLEYNPYLRTYLPTNRVALLGSWVDDTVIREGPILNLMRMVASETGLSVFLAARKKLNVQVIHVVRGRQTDAYVTKGSGWLMVMSASAGHALLGTMEDGEIAQILKASNVVLPDDSPSISWSDLLDTISGVRERGYALGSASRSREYSAIAIPLTHFSRETLVLGVGHFTAHIEDNLENILNIVRQKIGEIDIGNEMVY